MSSRGLEGVVVAESELSRIDGESGILIYRGHRIEDLAEHATFEEVCHLLWYGGLPGPQRLRELRRELAAERAVHADILRLLQLVPREAHPMAALRTAASALALHDPEAENMSRDANLRKAIRLTAQLATVTAAFDRIRRGLEPVEPDPELGHAANLLYMLRGERPDELGERIVDVALTLHAEHGMNASTFAARVTTATLSDMHSAVTSAIGTLKGPLHGGANERVMKMLLQIPSAEAADAHVVGLLDRGEKVMGFGHRVYRTVDPRAPILRALAEQLAREAGETRWLDTAERIVEVMRREMERRGKQVYPNVDFFSAPVYYTLGIPTDLFTNVFACARVVGWTAHVVEQLADNRLIRPRMTYIGPDVHPVAPLERREEGANA